MDKLVKFAIIGCGRISPNHLDAIKNAPHATLVAACDIDEQKAKAVADEYGCSCYTDIEQMISNEEIDVCCILTPSGYHAEHGCMAASHGINVFCEKPIDVTKEKADMLIKCCEENNVKLGCVFQRRVYDAAIKTKEAIEKGWLGTVTLADAYLKYYRDAEYYKSAAWRGTLELDCGALMNQSIHGIDLINWMMGGIESVDAKCKTIVWDIEAEDTAVIRVNYKNGAIGVIEGVTTAYPGLETLFSFHGSKGSIIFGDKGFYLWDLEDKSIPVPEVTNSMGGVNCGYNETNYGHTYLIEDMAMAVLEDRPPLIDGREAKKAVDIILAAYKSSEIGGEVNV